MTSATMYGMRKLVDIDLLDDEALQAGMAMDSLWIVLAGLVAGVLGAVALPHEALGPGWFVLLGVLSAAALPVHELVHAAAFRLLSHGSAHVRFGFHSWMLYTSAAGTVLSRGRFCVVLLAPAVLVTATLGVSATCAGWPLLGWALSVVHLAGCTGDFGYVRIIASEPQARMVEDTDSGISLYAED